MATASLSAPTTTSAEWRDAFALGVMVVPSNRAYRTAARVTWLPEAQAYATVRWVAGDVPCARKPLEDEAREHGDIVFVDSEDCQKWHSPAKVHAWYGFALRHFPTAAWIGKMEDDGLCVLRSRARPPLIAITHASWVPLIAEPAAMPDSVGVACPDGGCRRAGGAS
jgi:hypothetical protein